MPNPWPGILKAMPKHELNLLASQILDGMPAHIQLLRGLQIVYNHPATPFERQVYEKITRKISQEASAHRVRAVNATPRLA